MTVKIIALWSAPDDKPGFDEDYQANHVPLAGALPGIEAASFSKAVDGPYYRVAELVFSDFAAMQAAVGSEAGGALLADTARLQEAHGNKADALIVEVEGTI